MSINEILYKAILLNSFFGKTSESAIQKVYENVRNAVVR